MQDLAKQQSDRRRLLDKLLRELLRSETQALEHAPREQRRLGEMSPVLVLREVGAHAEAMRPRLDHVLAAHDITVSRGGISATLTSLRHLIVDHVVDAERAYRGALLDLRQGIEVVRVLRELSRLEELFGLIRWCDDWLRARRTLVARASAQLAWFAEREHDRPPIVGCEPPDDPHDANEDRDPLTSPAFLDWQ